MLTVESSSGTASSVPGAAGDLVDEGGAAKSQSYDFTTAKLTTDSSAVGARKQTAVDSGVGCS